MDQITDFLADLPIGLIIFIIAMAFGLFGRGDKQPQDAQAPRQQATRRPAQPAPPSIFASDDRRAREERAQRRMEERGEVITFGGLDFGSSDALFRDDEGERESQWGKTKYGFDESEWGSSFGDKKNPDPIIR